MEQPGLDADAIRAPSRRYAPILYITNACNPTRQLCIHNLRSGIHSVTLDTYRGFGSYKKPLMVNQALTPYCRELVPSRQGH